MPSKVSNIFIGSILKVEKTIIQAPVLEIGSHFKSHNDESNFPVEVIYAEEIAKPCLGHTYFGHDICVQKGEKSAYGILTGSTYPFANKNNVGNLILDEINDNEIIIVMSEALTKSILELQVIKNLVRKNKTLNKEILSYLCNHLTEKGINLGVCDEFKKECKIKIK